MGGNEGISLGGIQFREQGWFLCGEIGAWLVKRSPN